MQKLGLCFLSLISGLGGQTIRYYDIAANEQRAKFDHRAAVLAVAWQDAGHAYSGGLDTAVRQYVLCIYTVCAR